MGQLAEGSKKKWLRVDDIDNRELLTDLFIAIYNELPVSVPRKKNNL